MVLRKVPQGQFLACSGYPKCHNVIRVEDQGDATS
jgi:ssDNA-binding Zn-finger/Zn-ribbon topoisomerase 1